MSRKRKITYLSDESLTTMWSTFGERWDDREWRERIFWAMLLLATGCRIEEATHIAVDQVNGHVIEILDGKGHKDRDVEIDEPARPFVEWYVRRQILTGHKFLFPGQRKPKGCPDVRSCVSIRKARDWWSEVLTLAGVPYISPHGARRTFTTWNAERLSIQDMMDQLGHEDLSTTEQHYRSSIPGRRFKKPKPQWLETAEQVSKEFENRNTRHLRVVGE